MAKFKYRCADLGRPEFYEIDSSFDDAEDVAVEAAEDFHTNHDGWESNWPITFEIVDAEDISLGNFQVDRESVPHFYVSR
jgi:hypothetical protein